MEKNFWLALALSVLILMGYPYLLRWTGHSKPIPPAEISKEASPVAEAPGAVEKLRGPFLGTLTPPATVHYENEFFDIEFSTLGASIAKLKFKGESHNAEHTITTFYEGNPGQPGILGLRLLNEKEDLTQTIFQASREDKEKNLVEFIYEKPNEYRVVKQFVFNPKNPTLNLVVRLENLSPREKTFSLELLYGLQYELTDRITKANFESFVWTGKVESSNLAKISKKGFLVDKEIVWAGLLKRYFILLVEPDWKAVASEAQADSHVLWANLKMEPLSLAVGGRQEQHIFFYAGPQRYETLKSFGLGFENILSRGFFGIFKIGLLNALKFCNRFTHNFGWAIILVTLGLKGAFTPLTHMSFENMKKMQVLQPKLKSLQERYKNDPTKLNKEMMQLYKRNRVNPMGGCLPMVIQIPVFIAFYQVLSEAIELKGTPFIGWITDLSEPDRLFTFPMTLPVIGNSFHLLPIFMLISMFWQQKLTPQTASTPEQAKMMAFMPLIFGFIFYKMPSGLVLYWFVNNVLSIIHQTFVKRMVVVLHHEDRD